MNKCKKKRVENATTTDKKNRLFTVTLHADNIIFTLLVFKNHAYFISYVS